jgi:DNA-binding transcriptional ArsR family regulator
MDLIRTLLLKVEENPSPHNYLQNIVVAEYDADTTTYHLEMLKEAGLIDAISRNVVGAYTCWPNTLTWAGHDFLDSIRDPEIWRRTKEGASGAGGFTIELLADLAKGFLRKQIMEKTGFEL